MAASSDPQSGRRRKSLSSAPWITPATGVKLVENLLDAHPSLDCDSLTIDVLDRRNDPQSESYFGALRRTRESPAVNYQGRE